MRHSSTAVALVLVAGCSVPPTLIGNDAKRLEDELAAMESAKLKADDVAVARQMVRVSKLARELAATTFVGDPRRDLADKAEARVQELKAEADAKSELKRASDRDVAAAQAKAILQRVAAAKVTVKGPPKDLDLAPLSNLVPVETSAPKSTTPAGSADADLDKPGQRSGQREKTGDVSDEPAGFKAAKDGEKPEGEDQTVVVGEDTKPVTIFAPVVREKGVVVYFVFYNKGNNMFIGSVTGEVRGDRRGSTARLLATYEADGFEANWKDIFTSKGKTVTWNSTGVKANGMIKLAAVTESAGLGTITEVSIDVTTHDGRAFTGLWKKK